MSVTVSTEVVVALTDKALIEDPSVIRKAIAMLHRQAGIPEGEVGRVSLRGVANAPVVDLERVVLHVVLHVKP